MPTSRISTLARAGAATTLGGTAALMFGAPSTVSAGQPEPSERCIDEIDGQDTSGWDGDAWEDFWGSFFESPQTCLADFGTGKFIVSVVTEGGEPLPPDVDLTRILGAFDFGYSDPDRDANKAAFDSFCDLAWEGGASFIYEEDTLLGELGISYDDFRFERIPARSVKVLHTLGDRDLPATEDSIADAFDIEANELLFSWICNGDTDQLRILPVDDVGGGYRLLPGVVPGFTGFDQIQVSNRQSAVQFDVTVGLIPEQETTTTQATTTTAAPATTAAPTTVAPIVTQPAAGPAAPTTTMAPIAPVLPATGDGNGQLAALAALLAALGAGALLVSRRRTT